MDEVTSSKDSSSSIRINPVKRATAVNYDSAAGISDRAAINFEMDGDEIDLRALWLTLYRRRWSIISLSAIVVMLTILVVYSLTPIYKSTATLLVEPKDAQVVSIEQIYGLDGAGSEYLLTQFELLKSRELAEKVVRELALTRHFDFDPRQQPEALIDWSSILSSVKEYLPITRPGDLVNPPALSESQISDLVVRRFMGLLTVEPVLKTQLVKVSVEMADPVMATAAANALVNGYISSQLDARVSMTLTATSWMNERLVDLKDNLTSSESMLQAYREQENLLDVEGVTSVSADELSLISSSLAGARKTRAAAESEYRQIQSMKGAGWRSQMTVPTVMINGLVREFNAEEARAVTKVEELSRRYGDKHPKMQSARSELKTAIANLRAQVSVVVSGIERTYQLARSSEKSLTSSVEKNKGEIQSIQRKEFKLRELQREVDTNRTLYDTFLTRLKETSATTDIDTANARVVDRAVVPNRPIKPKKSLIVMLSGFLSLMLGVGLALLLEALNNTFKSIDDVENHLALPVLGILPLVFGENKQKIARLAAGDTDKSFAESVRSIRTSVMLSGLDKPHKIILVTSSVPQEGKSCVASNLAFSMGQLEKVLLVDADMRRPGVARDFGFPVGTAGLANLVAGTANIEECTHSVDGIDVLSAGIVPPNPLELLSSKRFAALIEVLGKKYDRIVMDSPPVQAVSDALVLSTFASIVIYVIKSDETSIPIAQKGIGQLLQNNAPMAGVILNQVDINKAEKYGYSYGGYYDYYGYSDDAKT